MMDILCNFVQQESSEFDSLSMKDQCNFQRSDILQCNNLTLAAVIPQKNVCSTKSKRSRSNYTNSQVEELEMLFQNNMYPDRVQRSEIAERLQLHDQQIRVWFQNRRTKQRKSQPGFNKNTKILETKNSQQLVVDDLQLYTQTESSHLYNSVQTTDFVENVDTLNADLKTPEKYISSDKKSFELTRNHLDTHNESDLLNISDVIETISRHELNTRVANITFDHQREENIERIKRDLELSVQGLSRSFVSNVHASNSYWLSSPITPPTPSVDYDWVIDSDQPSTFDDRSF